MLSKLHSWALVAGVVVAGCGPVTILTEFEPAPGPAPVRERLRVATWNIQAVGAPGSPQYLAARDVIGRIDVDVLALNEVAGTDDTDALRVLASELGYPHVAVDPDGNLRNAVLSRLPFRGTYVHTAASLSGDPQANDLARDLVEVEVDLGRGKMFRVVVEHWKSGTGSANEFRRSVESARISDVLDYFDSEEDLFVVVGDINEDLDDLPRPNPIFEEVPGTLPESYVLGPDMRERVEAEGLVNDPFSYIEGPDGLRSMTVDAWQLDGDTATRPASGRRIDYFFASREVLRLLELAEVYDSTDEGAAGGVVKAGNPLKAEASLEASDHLPVIIEFRTHAGPAR
jgi:exonuclease III